MKFISLFAGVGGFDLALEKAGHKCVWANDIDKYCAIIYEKNFNRKLDTRSIKDVPAEDIPTHEILCGGFPCQSFSIAGKRRGFEDTRGTLFFDIARIARYHKPRILFLENVKGLLSHDNGRTFKTIIATLDELGYDCQWQVLNSKNFGVPQNRERVFIVGHLRGTPRPEVFPFTGQSNKNTTEQKSTETAITRTLTAGGHSGGNHSGMTIIDMKSQGSKTRKGIIKNGYTGALDRSCYQAVIGTLRTHKDDRGFREMKSGISPTIPARAREDGSGQPIIIQDVRGINKKQNGKGFKEAQESYTVDTLATQGILSKTIRSGGRSSPHGSKQNWDSYQIGSTIRRLTPIECERLQGFPDNWTEGVSDTQRYKTMGNAVTVNVICEIAKLLQIPSHS